jgi:hypothetical protein
MTGYNGWTNYETWRVNLEMFDGMDIEETFRRKPDLGDLMEWAKDYANELLEIDAKLGLALDYAQAFISNVNWAEIARHWMDDHWQEEEEEEEEFA